MILRCTLMKDITHLDYHALRRDSPKTARRAVLQVLKAHNGNVSKTARIFKISRATVYKAIEKDAEKNLDDSSRAPHTVHNKTDTELEARVLQIRKQTGYGPLRIKEELEELDQISLSEHTIRNILRRNRDEAKPRHQKTANKTKRHFVDWYSAKAFEVVQIDLKYIVDQKALYGANPSYLYQ